MMFKRISVDLMAALVVGILTGCLAAVFNTLVIKGAAMTQTLLEMNRLFYILLPLTAALIMAQIYRHAFKGDHSGFGVVQVLAEMQLVHTHLMKPWSVFWRIVASMVNLVFGMTVGRFGPVVHLGAAVGSNLAYGIKADEDRIRLMIGCGAAAAIATVFNLPFFAALFVLEVLFRNRNFVFLAPLILSSVMAKVVGDALLGPRVPFVPELTMLSDQWLERFPELLVLGLVIGVLATLYLLSVEKFGKFFETLPHLELRFVLAALIVGGIAFFYPDQFEIHSGTTKRLFIEEFPIHLLFILSVVRIATAGISLGSGFIGGNFYPAVTIGAAGGFLTQKVLIFFGSTTVLTGEFGLLGVVGILSAYLHAPLASIVLGLEIARTTQILMPAMVISATALTVAHSLYGQDIFSKPLGKVLTELKKQ